MQVEVFADVWCLFTHVGLRRFVVRSWPLELVNGAPMDPAFIAGDLFCPSLDVSRADDGHLRITDDPEGFDAFVRSCREG